MISRSGLHIGDSRPENIDGRGISRYSNFDIHAYIDKNEHP